MQRQVMFREPRAFLYASSIIYILLTLVLCTNKTIFFQFQLEIYTGPNSTPRILYRYYIENFLRWKLSVVSRITTPQICPHPNPKNL